MAAELVCCPGCGGYVRSPIHLLGMAERWTPSLPFPSLRWCTPSGEQVLPFYETPGQEALGQPDTGRAG
jgi:hypothetical protein